MKRPLSIAGVFLLLWPALDAAGEGAVLSEAQREFFESRIRPILAQECYECHSEGGKAKGGLLLDSREGWKKGGESGAVIVPGQPDASLLFLSITHEHSDLKMPKAGAKLDPQVSADFREWIAMGAPDPRDAPPTSAEREKDTDWSAISARRAQWWSFQPILRPAVPGGEGGSAPVDAFVRAKLAAEGLDPAPPADPRTLLRRLHFNLVGLPPTPEETSAFLAAWEVDPDKATERLVDRLLADPGFGEHWARHWMDWIRYADTHGSEGDPAIPHAWRYRDYLVRALNDDVPLDQMILEHFAGDLLDEPRVNRGLGLNESALGTAHLRMVFHGFSPTDALDERVRFTDDQINTVTKAFLGLTVSCARCHDHKFDAISQADYYALFGIFSSALPATVAVDAPGVLGRNREELVKGKAHIRRALADHWLASLPESSESWRLLVTRNDRAGAGAAPDLLRRLVSTKENSEALKRAWTESEERFRASELAEAAFDKSVKRRWLLSDPDEFEAWSRYGEGLLEGRPSPPGDYTLSVGTSGDRIVEAILPGGVFSHVLSTRHRAVLASPPFRADEEYDLFVRVAGEGGSFRYVVQHYPRSGTIYPVSELKGGRWSWMRHPLDYWKGDDLHLELATAGDAPVLVKEAERSWFGIREAVLVPKGSPPPGDRSLESLGVVFGEGEVPANLDEALARFDEVFRTVLPLWGEGVVSLTDAQALFLDEALAAGWLGNTMGELPPALADLVSTYRRLETEVPVPTRAPGVFERPGLDQALFVRGDHKLPAETVPRRFLEEIDPTPYKTEGTGRLEFARDLVSPRNSFTSRVLVNRVWTHLFGQGIVPTPDNFGRLGEPPSHPALLDWLANRFREEQAWSLKALVRDLVLTETWRQSGGPSREALAKDPDNRLLSSYPLRRLEAESIRDALVAVSGELDRELGGPPFVGAAPRRALYLRVKRNHLDPFLTTFDFPTPASTVGRRDVTNVPAQSLTLLNDPFLIARATRWARQLLADRPGADDETLVTELFEAALTRPPSESERVGAREFLAAVDRDHHTDVERYTAAKETSEKTRLALAALVDPVRTRLEGARLAAFTAANGGSSTHDKLRPVGAWDFEEDSKDRVGRLDLTLHGSARIEDGALVVDEKGWASGGPLPFSLGAKTLEARVRLATLDQAGGGVITVQRERGAVFDSLVFGEKRKGEWLAGSEFFQRTLDFGADPDKAAAAEVVHLILSYEDDGSIQCYRNGEPWGERVRKSELATYPAGEAELLFGLRHGGGPNPGKSLRGHIYEARLYDRALDASEARSAYRGGPAPVLRGDLEEALGAEASLRWRGLESELDRLRKDAAELEKLGAKLSAQERRWRDLAHAIFNLKEFIYLR